jgi:hypothetical protein
MRVGGAARTAVEMGLVGVTATQLWHQTFIDSSLADVQNGVNDRLATLRRSVPA